MHFFDTNILVHTVEEGDPSRSAIALELVRSAMRDGVFVISTQVMLEFYAASQRRKLVNPGIAVQLLQEWTSHGAVSTTAESLWRAFAIQHRYGLSIWDAMIVQSALESHCDLLYSEDLQHGQQIDSLRIVNPFQPAAVHEPAATHRATSSKAVPRGTRAAAVRATKVAPKQSRKAR